MTTFRKGILFALFLSMGLPGMARTIYVSTSGVDDVAHDGSTPALAKATIGAAFQIAALSGDVIQVLPGTYNGNMNLSGKSFTLQGAANVGDPKPILTYTSGTGGIPLITMSASPNTVIKGFQLEVNLTFTQYGITADNCANLTIQDIALHAIGTSPYTFLHPIADGIRVRNGNDPTFPAVLLQNITVTPTLGTDVTNTYYFDRGITLQSVKGTIGGTTAQACTLMAARDVLLQFAGGGVTSIQNNIFNGGGIDVTLPDTSGNVQVDNNRFDPAPGRPTALLPNLIFIKENAHRAPIAITNNQLFFSTVGITAGGATNTTIRGNTFTPRDSARNITCIEVNTFWEFNTPIALPFTPNSIFIYDNTFNGTTPGDGKGIVFKNERKGAASPDYDQIVIGGGGANANRFAESLGRYVRLANQRGKTFFNNLDMSGNSFQINGTYNLPATMAQADLFKLEDKFDHAIDDDSVGLIRVKPNDLFVTPKSYYPPLTNQASIQRAIAPSVAGDVVNIRDSIYLLPVNIDKDLTFAPSGAATVLGTLTMATPNNQNQLRITHTMTSQGDLVLTNGRLRLQNSDYRLTNPSAASPPAGSDSSYVMTDGNGRLVLANVGTDVRNFPIGTDSAFRPVQVANLGTTDSVGLRIKHKVLQFATSGPAVDTVVDFTWFFTEGTPGGGSYTFRPLWKGVDERPEFYRDRTYLQRFNQNRWEFLTGPAPRFLPLTGTDPYQVTASNLTQSFAFDTPLRLFGPKEIPDTIYYVDGVDGADDYPNLSGRTPESAWKTIQYAVTTASRYNQSGSFVAPSGFIHIHVKNVPLPYDGAVTIPANKGRLVIRGGYLGDDAAPVVQNTTTAAPAITVSADTVFLRKLNIPVGLSGGRTGISGQTTYDRLVVDSCMVRNVSGGLLCTGIDLAATAVPRIFTVTASHLFGDQPTGPYLAQGIVAANAYGTIGGKGSRANQIAAADAVDVVGISIGSMDIIGNTVTTTGSGIRINSGNGSATVTGNTISGTTSARRGIQAFGFTDQPTTLRIDSNSINADTCLHLVNNHQADISSNTLVATSVAVHINSGFAGQTLAAPVLGSVTMLGNQLTPPTAGLSTAVFLGNEAKAQISPAFGDITIGTSSSPNTMGTGFTRFIEMESKLNAEFDQDVDARNNNYGTTGGPKTPSAMTQDELFDLENHIVHKIDFAALGLARVRNNELYVTPQSFIAPRTTTPAIGRTVPPSVDGDKVFILDGNYPDTAVVDKTLTFTSKANQTVAKGLQMNGNGKLLTIVNDYAISGALILTDGRIKITTNNLILQASCPQPVGGSPTSYVWTSGTGGLRQNQVGTGIKADSLLYPIGLEANYNPLFIGNKSAAGDFHVRLLPDVFQDGLNGAIVPDSVVQASWVITTPPGAGKFRLHLTPFWNGVQEKQAFDRSRVGIEGYFGGRWVPQSIRALAVGGPDPYFATRIMPDTAYNGTVIRVISIAPLPDAVFIPTLFTPNDDGMNDQLLAYSNNIQTISLKIFNRYGNIVYQTDDVTDALTKGWDGTSGGQKCNTDTYVWNISGTYKDGKSIDVAGKKTGYVILSR